MPTENKNDTLDGTPTELTREEFEERLDQLLDQGRTDEANRLIENQFPDEDTRSPVPSPEGLPVAKVPDLSSLKKNGNS